MAIQHDLLLPSTSRANKLWIAIDRGIPWRWQGVRMRSRLELFVDGQWRECKSFDEDIRPTLKDK